MNLKVLFAATALIAYGTTAAEPVRVPAVSLAESAAAVVMPAGAKLDTLARIAGVVGKSALAAAEERYAGNDLQGYADSRIAALSNSTDPATKAALVRWKNCVTNYCVVRLAGRESFMLALQEAADNSELAGAAVYLSRMNTMLSTQVPVRSLSRDEYRVAMTEAMYDSTDAALLALVEGEPLYTVVVSNHD